MGSPRSTGEVLSISACQTNRDTASVATAGHCRLNDQRLGAGCYPFGGTFAILCAGFRGNMGHLTWRLRGQSMHTREGCTGTCISVGANPRRCSKCWALHTLLFDSSENLLSHSQHHHWHRYRLRYGIIGIGKRHIIMYLVWS